MYHLQFLQNLFLLFHAKLSAGTNIIYSKNILWSLTILGWPPGLRGFGKGETAIKGGSINMTDPPNPIKETWEIIIFQRKNGIYLHD